MPPEAVVPISTVKQLARQIAREEIAEYARSGPLRNATISGGKGLTVTAGSRFVVQHPDGRTMLLAGAYDADHAFDMPDGSQQPVVQIIRADGSTALAMYDPFPGQDSFRQLLAIIDGSGNVVLNDDNVAGQGLARPNLQGQFYPVRYADMTVSTTSPTFETLFRGSLYKQQAQLAVGVQHTMDTSGTSGEVRVLVNNVQMGAVATSGFVIAGSLFGPSPVAGAHMAPLSIEIQGRCTSASGALRAVPYLLTGSGSAGA